MRSTRTSSAPLDDERERDAEQRERLDQADPDEHGGPDLVRVLRLSSHRLDRLPDQDPQANPGTDPRDPDDEPLADRLQPREITSGLCEQPQHPFLPWFPVWPSALPPA